MPGTVAWYDSFRGKIVVVTGASSGIGRATALVFAAAGSRLVEVSVPPGAATLEKLGALAPGVADTIVHWAKRVSHRRATGIPGSAHR